MGEPVVALPSFEELCEYVRRALCEQDALDPEQTPFFRSVVRRGGAPCGVVFHVEGPRLLRTSAVWAADSDRIVFYNSTGQRTHEVRLSEAPAIADLRLAHRDSQQSQQAA
jgi:hypothetical protein